MLASWLLAPPHWHLTAGLLSPLHGISARSLLTPLHTVLAAMLLFHCVECFSNIGTVPTVRSALVDRLITVVWHFCRRRDVPRRSVAVWADLAARIIYSQGLTCFLVPWLTWSLRLLIDLCSWCSVFFCSDSWFFQPVAVHCTDKGYDDHL